MRHRMVEKWFLWIIGLTLLQYKRTYVLVLPLNLTKWIEVFKFGENRGPSLLDGRKNWVAKHGMPKIWIMYQGGYIITGLVKAYCAQQGMEICYSAPGVHKSNGFVERAIKTIARKIRKVLVVQKFSDQQWSYVWHEVVNLICQTLHGTDRSSRLRLHYGLDSQGHRICNTSGIMN